MTNIPIITPAFGIVIGWIYNLCNNYMVALVIFAILVKIILFPFGIKQQKNSLKQAKLRPMETVIRRKYAGRKDQATQQKLNQEIMELYQSENFNPASGCLPMLIQMPILFGLYGVIVNPLKYISGLGKEVVNVLCNVFGTMNNYDINVIKAISDMGSAVKPAVITQINEQFASQGIQAEATEVIAKITELTKNFSVFGIDLTVNPTMGLNPYIVIPILTFVFAFFSQKIIRKYTYQPQQTEGTQNSMAMMEWTMPLLSVWISFSVPAAIAIYWIIQNILSAVQQMVLHKMYPIPAVTDEQIKEAELKYKGKSADKKKKTVLSEPDANSPIYEEVPEVDFKDNTVEVNARPLGLTPKFKKHLKETRKPLKARRKI